MKGRTLVGRGEPDTQRMLRPLGASWEPWREELYEKHLVDTGIPVQTSTGPTTKYLDAIGALLDTAYYLQIIEWLTKGLQMDDRFVWPIAQGQGGALMLGIVGFGTHLSAPYKGHGIAVHGILPAAGTEVALLDDCSFSGDTLERLRLFCKNQGLVPVQELVLFDMRGR